MLGVTQPPPLQIIMVHVWNDWHDGCMLTLALCMPWNPGTNDRRQDWTEIVWQAVSTIQGEFTI